MEDLEARRSIMVGSHRRESTTSPENDKDDREAGMFKPQERDLDQEARGGIGTPAEK